MLSNGKVKLGMTPNEVIEIFGVPDRITEQDYKTHWEWENLKDEDSQMRVSVDFIDGAVKSVSILGRKRR